MGGATPSRAADRPQRGSARIEGFSDTVFGFALTLLVVSLEVPKSFAELAETMEGFVAFALCFALIVWIWVEHFRFFRAFALADGTTIFWNAVLLFVVLFYVYPLKYLFTALVKLMSGLGPALPAGGMLADGRQVLRIYSLGFTVVFLVLAALYRHAWAKRDALPLDLLGRHDARSGIVRHAATAGVGLLSIALTFLLPDRLLAWAGWLFASLGPLHGVLGYRRPCPARSRARRARAGSRFLGLPFRERRLRRSALVATQAPRGRAVMGVPARTPWSPREAVLSRTPWGACAPGLSPRRISRRVPPPTRREPRPRSITGKGAGRVGRPARAEPASDGSRWSPLTPGRRRVRGASRRGWRARSARPCRG